TNDMVLLMANEQAGNTALTPAHPEWDTFVDLLRHIATDLAKQIARDGEGATKLIEVEVTGAENDTAAKQVAAVSFSAPVTSTSINLVAPSPSLAICFAKS